jgi:hypothetical protein
MRHASERQALLGDGLITIISEILQALALRASIEHVHGILRLTACIPHQEVDDPPTEFSLLCS